MDVMDVMDPARAEARRARADARLAIAREVLAELGLLRRWRPYGDPVVVGSVSIGVVVAPDIDIEVFADRPRVADGFAVMRELAELPAVRRLTYLDARDRHEQGQYWKLEYELTTEETWTIDTWIYDREVVPPSARGGPLAEAIREALTDESRDRILAVKEEGRERGERVRGYWLYQAVLEAGVRTYAGYREWLGDRNIYTRTGWFPARRRCDDRGVPAGSVSH